MKDRKEVDLDGRGGGVKGVEGEGNPNWNILCEKKFSINGKKSKWRHA